jgi:hypothetical protein
MTVAWRAGWRWLLVVGLTAGCGGVRAPDGTPPPRGSRQLDAADALVQEGRYADAREAYAMAMAEQAASPDRALLGLARLALDPNNPTQDERQAAEYLDRLLAEYPQSRWAVEARTWRSLLRSEERLQRDVRRTQQDLARLRRELQRAQQQTVRLRDEREQLRQIDAEFERPRSPEIAPTSTPVPSRPRD